MPSQAPKKPARARAAKARARSAVPKAAAAAPATASPSAAASPPGPPVVGLGASAGGLEALEAFLAHVPPASGLAYVVVQHLDPTHKGMMVELLQRATAMPVVQVEDRMAVQPDHVYVIPPNRDLSILRGLLHLLEPAAPRGLRLPIDFFFRSLADDQHDRSVGVVLSGMGSDGTLGLRAIKEKAGLVLVQAPASAKFDGMPRSAIAAGLADVVAPVEELPAKLIAGLQRVPLLAQPERAIHEKARSALEKVVIVLRAQTGHDFSEYKPTTILRRIERRMGIHQLTRVTDYVRYLRETPQEAALLFKELLIGVTSFFRDPTAWEQLQREVLPELVVRHPPGPALRAWVAGCATGEEAYSLAIAFREALNRLQPARNLTLQIFATDLDRDAVGQAREGVFPANIAADVPPEYLSRYFVQVERGYQVARPIRELVTFAPQNVIMDPPFTKLDLLVCRNLLIYLTPALQKKLLPLFHYCLNPGGCLFLGSAETVGSGSDLFAPLDPKARLYRRLEPRTRTVPVDFPAAFAARPGVAPVPEGHKPAASLQALAEQLLLQQFSPAAVLVTDQGDIVYISGRTGKYLEPAAGKANWNLFVMAREGLRHELTGAFRTALRQRAPVTVSNLIVGTNGGTQAVTVTIQPLTEPEALRGMVMVIFADVATPPEVSAPGKARRTPVRQAREAEQERELAQLRHELQTTREEMQSAQEELKSANEELQSTNEELQSTNEELTTSKEEMQSLNEELQTVNHELQAKLDELSLASSDMKNLLDSTEIATLFLDDALRVRRFTNRAAKLIKLIPGDVGRPVTDIATDLAYPEFSGDVREVLQTLVPADRTVPAGDGRWFQVRVMPYRTLDNRIDGVVITLTDVTAAKTLEAQLRQSAADPKGGP